MQIKKENNSNCLTIIFAIVLLVVMGVSALLSMKQAALTFDELAHIPAGYSYLAKQDYRVNPEHPPLVKNIPALPLLFLDLNFPDDREVWQQQKNAPAWWVQFDLGREFIYHSHNNPREIIFWSRFAMIVLLVALGGILFWWTKKLAGNAVATGALTLFAFSPTFIAHGRLVNTDIGAVVGVVLAVIFWLKFLETPSWKNVLLAGIAFGIAMLLKFSLILLVPFFVIITLFYVFLFSKKLLLPYLGKSLLAGLAGFVLIVWPVYQFHIANYPAEQQLRDTIADISNHPVVPARNLTLWMTEQEALRAPAQYFRGLLMASQRTMWGNTAYFLGEMSADSWWHYFPLLYLLKIPLAFHFLTLIALAIFLFRLKKLRKNKELYDKMRQRFWIPALMIWIAVYWISTLVGNLNIGIRHLLPIFPFMYILVVYALCRGFRAITVKNLRHVTAGGLSFLFLWYVLSSLSTFPHYIPYYNKLAGGAENGYKIAVDSNYDWGQDFYRLLDFVEKNNIEKISIDYFGGEDPQYWLGEKYEPLEPRKIRDKQKPAQGWLAVSINQMKGGTAAPAEGFDQETGYYHWLLEHDPVARAGYSIFIYYIE